MQQSEHQGVTYHGAQTAHQGAMDARSQNCFCWKLEWKTWCVPFIHPWPNYWLWNISLEGTIWRNTIGTNLHVHSRSNYGSTHAACQVHLPWRRPTCNLLSPVPETLRACKGCNTLSNVTGSHGVMDYLWTSAHRNGIGRQGVYWDARPKFQCGAGSCGLC